SSTAPIILIGSKAWQAWNKGEGLEWSLLAQAIKTDPKQPPVIIGESQLSEINFLNLAENDRTSVRLCQFGKFSHSEALPAVVANLAKNTQVQQLTLCDSLGELQENGNLSDWLKRTREQKGDSVADILASLAQDEDVKREPYIEKRTENGQRGLFYITPKFDRTTGEFISEKVQFLSDIVEVVGVGYNAEESHLILKFTPENRKKAVIVAQPLATIGKREGWQQLKAKGLRVTNNGTLKGVLADYLQLSGNRQEWQVTDKTGWINGAYILPNGEIIGESSKPTIFIGGTSVKSGYCTAGTAESWREQIANYAKNNASMMLAVSVALAGPMLTLLKKEPFGVHLYGDSSVGKTTTAYLASSVFGHPKDTKLSWFSTALGVANEALAHNDGFLFLDEVGQASNAKEIEISAYTLFNGVGKIQGAKEGGNRKIKTTRYQTGKGFIY
ncbi:DUF927 domain-containing protein, partial [Rodentibacter rarus]|uniref:DUF927 domain-containing protein n=1 Tax=Rodentibacter rarus TaxID=1908260 RepID=UPI00117A6103